MKNIILKFISVIIIILISFPAFAAKDVNTNRYSIMDNISIDVDNDIIILTSKHDHRQYVEITSDYQLFVNGKEVELTRSQRRLVANYYNQFFEIISYAKEIGIEGARVGIAGAKVGVQAAAKAIKAIFADYDEEELDEELEYESEELKLLISELEEKAEELEELADEFEDLHYELRNEIDELYNLKWF